MFLLVWYKTARSIPANLALKQSAQVESASPIHPPNSRRSPGSSPRLKMQSAQRFSYTIVGDRGRPSPPFPNPEPAASAPGSLVPRPNCGVLTLTCRLLQVSGRRAWSCSSRPGSSWRCTISPSASSLARAPSTSTTSA